jgi:hypothetical protein
MAKSVEKARMRNRRRAVGAESPARSGWTSVKGRRTGAVQVTRSFGGTKKIIHTPDVTDAPKRTS